MSVFSLSRRDSAPDSGQDLAAAYANAERDRIASEAKATRERIDRDARRDAELARRQARRDDRAARRVDRAATLSYAGQSMARLGRLAVPLAPLVAVNALAVTGQVGYAVDHIQGGWPVAVLFAVALESIALFLGYHASAALRRRESAAGMQLAAYLVAAVVAGINYAHYAGPHLAPTVTGVAFGLVSLLSPWLWRVHSRAAHRDALHKAGEIDVRAVRLSASRKLWHPIRSLRVIRWAAWEGVDSPREAIAGWTAYEQARAAAKAAEKATRGGTVVPVRGWLRRHDRNDSHDSRITVDGAVDTVAALPAGQDGGADRAEAASADRSGRSGQVRATVKTAPRRTGGQSSKPAGKRDQLATADTLAAELDRLGVPRSAGRPVARAALKEAGRSAATDLLAAALRVRQADKVTDGSGTELAAANSPNEPAIVSSNGASDEASRNGSGTVSGTASDSASDNVSEHETAGESTFGKSDLEVR